MCMTKIFDSALLFESYYKILEIIWDISVVLNYLRLFSDNGRF